ncbi:MAG: SulP family inorganic anion transporter [Leptospirillia bacterium]
MFDIYHTHFARLRSDILSGLTVALALVPEAVAFAFVAGVHPLSGLYAAFMVGLITAVIGGRPGMISGATGALAVVMVALVAEHGAQYLFAAVVLMGIIQISAGVLKLGKFMRIVPYPVMLGFVNGLAIVIFLAQLSQFQIHTADGGREWLATEPLLTMLGLVALTMAIIHFLPRLTRQVPSSLVAIVALTLLVVGFGLDTRTVGDVASIGGGLPVFHIPTVPMTLETLWIILPYSIIFAAIGLIESLLTMRVIDEITETRGRGNRECVAQGVANTATGLFGGMGGCAMIGQSMINIHSGGLGRASGVTAALALLCFILFASPLIEMIPIAALVGVMFIVVLGTFEWASLRLFGKVPQGDLFVAVLVTGVTVATDLAVAVLVGVIASALIFAWEHAKQIGVSISEDADGAKVYDLSGPLFFGSIHQFHRLFHPAADPDKVIVEFRNSRVLDHSAIEAIDTLAERYKRAGKNLHLRHLSAECRQLLEKAGDLVEVNIQEDPSYFVATDKLA